MAVKQLTTDPTEADLEAAIHAAVGKVFPWLGAKSIRHQTKFAFTFGRTTIEVDGLSGFRKEARADIILYHGDRPLAVLELKRPRVDLSPEDDAQGLSYARVLVPSPPVVVVTNGDEVRLLETHTGDVLQGGLPSEAAFKALIESAARAASASLEEAIDTLMGTVPAVWKQALEQLTELNIAELTGGWHDPHLPFVDQFRLPRKATAYVSGLLKRGYRLILVEGAPIVGKSNVLRDLIRYTRLNDEFVTLFLEASGVGVVQTLADALSSRLSWPVTVEDARRWLIRLSRGSGPRIVLAIDGLDLDQTDVRREIEDLSSNAFGDRIHLVVAMDDAVADRLVSASNGRSMSQIGRRAQRVLVGDLDDEEFGLLEEILLEQRFVIMKGGAFSPELRLPWVLRALIAEAYDDLRDRTDGSLVALPPMLNLGLLAYARRRFTDPELRRRLRGVANAVLLDARDRTRSISLTLEAVGTFIVRRSTLLEELAAEEIQQLVSGGYLKPLIHESGEAVLVARLPEAIASELADLLARELATLGRTDPEEAATWIEGAAGMLPLGDVILAQAILDAAKRYGGIPVELVTALLLAEPRERSIEPGMRMATWVAGVGTVDLCVQDDGSLQATVNGIPHALEADPDGDWGTTYVDFHSFLVLSHLGGLAIELDRDEQRFRMDPFILAEVGKTPFVLRRPDPRSDSKGILVHDIPGVGNVVCHAAGIVEPITLSILEFLTREGGSADEWIHDACRKGSLPLVGRIDIALRHLAVSENPDVADWAQEMLGGPIAEAFANLPQLHPEAE